MREQVRAFNYWAQGSPPPPPETSSLALGAASLAVWFVWLRASRGKFQPACMTKTPSGGGSAPCGWVRVKAGMHQV